MELDLKQMIVLGVAGNFAGHLEQAVKNIDFGAAADPNAPKGLFPLYVPSSKGRFIEDYPISADRLVIPEAGATLKIEPEVAIVCQISYDDGRVTALTPLKFTAYNDCSIHNIDVNKISEKKNWGAESKGFSDTYIDIDQFDEDGILNSYQLACYLLRDGQLHAYGVESPVREYSYIYGQLVDWMIEKMNTQPDSGPFESIADLLHDAGYPEYALIGIGATRYTDFGDKTYLEPGDESIVVVYDGNRYDTTSIEQRLLAGDDTGDGLIVLRQVVVQS